MAIGDKARRGLLWALSIVLFSSSVALVAFWVVLLMHGETFSLIANCMAGLVAVQLLILGGMAGHRAAASSLIRRMLIYLVTACCLLCMVGGLLLLGWVLYRIAGLVGG